MPYKGIRTATNGGILLLYSALEACLSFVQFLVVKTTLRPAIETLFLVQSIVSFFFATKCAKSFREFIIKLGLFQ